MRDAGEAERLRELVAVPVNSSASSGPIPISPAIAPDRMIVFRTIAFGFTPAVRAAAGWRRRRAARTRTGCG